MSAIIPLHSNTPLPAKKIERAKDYARAATSEATQRAYQSDFAIFSDWCTENHVSALPANPESIAGFLAHEADRGIALSTIRRRRAAIRLAHKSAGIDPLPTNSETVAVVLRGIARTKSRKQNKKAPALADSIRLMAQIAMQNENNMLGMRDRALLLIGFSGAFRRSELVAIRMEHLTFQEQGIDIYIPSSKTDQEGEGATVSIVRGRVTCPAQALTEYLDAANITDGPIFRRVRRGGHIQSQGLCAGAVAEIVKRYAKEAGLCPENFAGHSLRSGFITSAVENGAEISRVKDVSRHKSTDILLGYVRHSARFKNHAGDGLL